MTTDLRTPKQIAEEMASEMRRRFGFKATEPLVQRWLQQCIIEIRHEVAVEMMRAGGPAHAAERTT